jgi:septum formation protein
MSLILASTSPRRKDLLSLLEVEFHTAAPSFAEDPRPDLPPVVHAQSLAEGKALSCARLFPSAHVLASDTLIVVDGGILGKPNGRSHAMRMLHQLRGREHLVHTAVALVHLTDGIRRAGVETVRVWMKAITDQEIEGYLDTGEFSDKAGAYGIQGRGGDLIDHIEGDFTAVVGFPLKLATRLLHACGVTVPVDIESVYREKPFPNWARFSPQCPNEKKSCDEKDRCGSQDR